MAIPKPAARIDDWREYFRSANANIFEILEGAIMVAASDFPKEFKKRRDGIAQILYSCRLTKCTGCDKEELAVPVDNQEHEDHDHDDGDHKGVRYESNLTGVDDDHHDDDDDDEDDDHDHVKLNVNNQHVSNYSYGDAEALNDAIEEETQMFGEVLRIKEIVDNSPDESVSVLCNSLRKLQLMELSVETLKATDIGISVNFLRKHASKDVRRIAISLIELWKGMVDEWMKSTTKISVSETTPESMNPSGLDEEEEEGLPSPPLDDLTFLNPHSMSLELSEKFFDGMDDYGNPRKSGEYNKNHNSGGKPPVEKQNKAKRKQHKPLNGPTMVPKEPTPVKPTKPLVTGSAPRRQMKPNMDRKLQNSEKPTLPKTKPRPSGEESVQDKLEVTKRKLQERYQEAEKAKRQRTIQVMELHDLPKQGMAPKNQHMRPGNHHNRHWAHGRG